MMTPDDSGSQNSENCEYKKCGACSVSGLATGVALGVAIGAGFGAGLGAAFENIGVGIAIGTALGVSLGCAGIGACVKRPKPKSGEPIES